MTLHVDNLGVTATDDCGEKRELWIVATEPVGVDVRFEMMGRVERLIMKDGERASGKGTDEKTANETRGVSDSDSVDAIDSEIGVG